MLERHRLIRFRVRTLIVLVAVVAFLLALEGMRRRREYCLNKAALYSQITASNRSAVAFSLDHARAEEASARSWREKAEQKRKDAGEAASRSNGGDPRAFLDSLSGPDDPADNEIASALRAEANAAILKRLANHQRSLAEHNARAEALFLRAARRPWLRIPEEPPARDNTFRAGLLRQ